MSRNLTASYEHRGSLRLGAPLGLMDFLREVLLDLAIGQIMIDTATAGWFDAEVAPVSSSCFELLGTSLATSI